LLYLQLPRWIALFSLFPSQWETKAGFYEDHERFTNKLKMEISIVA